MPSPFVRRTEIYVSTFPQEQRRLGNTRSNTKLNDVRGRDEGTVACVNLNLVHV